MRCRPSSVSTGSVVISSTCRPGPPGPGSESARAARRTSGEAGRRVGEVGRGREQEAKKGGGRGCSRGAAALRCGGPWGKGPGRAENTRAPRAAGGARSRMGAGRRGGEEGGGGGG